MSNAMQATQSAIPALAMDENELCKVLTTSLYPGAAIESIKLVISYCKASQLDPMQKPVHIVPMWDKATQSMRDVIMPGVGLYRTQAARTGQYVGVSEPEFGPDVTEKLGGVEITYPKWCKVTVKRQLDSGTVAEFTSIEFWKENYATAKKDSLEPNAMWKKRPYGQISKCVEAQSLRKAFPELGAAPTADEMEGREIELNPAPEAKKGPQPRQESAVIDGGTGEIIQPEAKPLGKNAIANIQSALDREGKSAADLCAKFNLPSLADITTTQVDDVRDWINKKD
jgi:phage recombination protein Bet